MLSISKLVKLNMRSAQLAKSKLTCNWLDIASGAKPSAAMPKRTYCIKFSVTRSLNHNP